ncbi:MAG: IS1380 family transposase [Candidatus Riflebacteria bacterium]|nr:IS1380 family transposase [Candidatus Riflebacteria bacterium]
MIPQAFLPFKLEMTSDEMTPHAGLALIGEFIRSLGLPAEVDRLLPTPGSSVGYRPAEFVFPLVLMLHGGGKTLEDLREIRRDTGLRRLLEIEGVPSSDASGDWLRRMAWQGRGLRQLERIRKNLLSRSLHLEASDEYTLDFDASQIIAEKQSAQKTYKGEIGYMPLVGTLAENGLIIGADFRDGNVSPGDGNLGFIKYCLRQLPKGKRITAIRSDAAAYQSGIINYCEDRKMTFAIGGHLNEAVKNAIHGIAEADWMPYQDGHMAETIHSMEETKESFRLIVVRRPVQPDLDGTIDLAKRYKVIATNRIESPREVLAWYNQRGETSENRIKELKIDFGMERMPCGTTAANAVYFCIGTLAYNLYRMFRDWALPAEWGKHRVETIRWKLYQMAGKVVRHAGTLVLKVQAWAFDLFQDIRTGYKELEWT